MTKEYVWARKWSCFCMYKSVTPFLLTVHDRNIYLVGYACQCKTFCFEDWVGVFISPCNFVMPCPLYFWDQMHAFILFSNVKNKASFYLSIQSKVSDVDTQDFLFYVLLTASYSWKDLGPDYFSLLQIYYEHYVLCQVMTLKFWFPILTLWRQYSCPCICCPSPSPSRSLFLSLSLHLFLPVCFPQTQTYTCTYSVKWCAALCAGETATLLAQLSTVECRKGMAITAPVNLTPEKEQVSFFSFHGALRPQKLYGLFGTEEEWDRDWEPRPTSLFTYLLISEDSFSLCHIYSLQLHSKLHLFLLLTCILILVCMFLLIGGHVFFWYEFGKGRWIGYKGTPILFYCFRCRCLLWISRWACVCSCSSFLYTLQCASSFI